MLQTLCQLFYLSPCILWNCGFIDHGPVVAGLIVCQSLPSPPLSRTCLVCLSCFLSPFLEFYPGQLLETDLIVCIASPLPLCFGLSVYLSVFQGPTLWEGWFLSMSLFQAPRGEVVCREHVPTHSNTPYVCSFFSFLTRSVLFKGMRTLGWTWFLPRTSHGHYHMSRSSGKEWRKSRGSVT